ncbi:helix-turn-helix domain-containing protein [Actinoplanes sichuanensis]|uniref:ArsR/SmtB family transcription factor n=1 Tax=Actinoplanes sichuanensis TaxID=512349 RepID=A0ABW4A6F1_9ACTN|nr:helix-turn-helix domain-containing protein [Actinoplanes sichuanensis]BEL05196.1 helix-turn-helix domain-containing protein [Actinoplanes sichuanensis]
MSLTNPLGDLEISDPQALRALAHPVRLAILNRLQRHGPATATQLSAHVGATPSVVSWHARHLASFGLLVDWDGAPGKRERWWQAAAKGFRFTVPEDAEGQDAARMLQSVMFARAAEYPQQWLMDVEPHLDEPWRRLGGLADTRFVVTADELEQLQDAIERLIAPYARRAAADRPADARGVRLLRFALPENEDSP